jgi:hypothetical protein
MDTLQKFLLPASNMREDDVMAALADRRMYETLSLAFDMRFDVFLAYILPLFDTWRATQIIRCPFFSVYLVMEGEVDDLLYNLYPNEDEQPADSKVSAACAQCKSMLRSALGLAARSATFGSLSEEAEGDTVHV